jgi:eukaryotic-like serine/threonine-protein kinase
MKTPIDRISAALADRYRIEREIGKGGMARVYLAHDVPNDREVAIKILRADVSVELGAERFLREITTTAHLHHPHILPLYDSGQIAVESGRSLDPQHGNPRTQDLLYYVMPYIAGENLRDRIDREHQLPIDEAIQLTRQIADALAYAHEQGVIHRDIKPANILLQGDQAMVADFGVARAVSVAGTERITRSGITVGTPMYMSPEQAAGAIDLDGRSDLYGLACVFYEMLGGQPPFTGPTAAVLTRQHMTAPPPPISHFRTGVPEPVAKAIDRALAKAPGDRFRTLGEFSAVLGGEPLPPSPRWTGRVPMIPPPWRIPATIAGLVVLVMLVWLLFLRS